MKLKTRHLESSPFFHRIRTDSIRESVKSISSVFSPHNIRRLSPCGAPAVELLHAALPSISVNVLHYGINVEIEAQLGTWFGCVFPLQGTGVLKLGDEDYPLKPNEAWILSPTDKIKIQYGHDQKTLVVKVDRIALERAVSATIGRPLEEPVVFSPVMRAKGPAGSAFWRITQLLIDELGDPSSPLNSKNSDTQIERLLIDKQLEILVINTLMLCQDSNYSNEIADQKSTPAPRHVKLAEGFILSNPEEHISLERLSEITGVSPRTLHHSFRQFRGVSPMKYLKNVRFERARRDLLNAAPDETITRIATRWGFNQLGRFSIEYKARYGESPSDTIRQPVR